MAINHHLGTKNSFSRGQAAEDAFKRECENMGWSVKPATPAEERHHVDFHLTTPSGVVKVDVKAHKEVFAVIDGKERGDVMLVEFDNVHGGAGWLRGMADYIVQRKKDGGWLWFDRRKLLEEAIMWVDMTDWVDHFSKAHRKIYRRRDRRDRVSILTLDEVKEAIVLDWEAE